MRLAFLILTVGTLLAAYLTFYTSHTLIGIIVLFVGIVMFAVLGGRAFPTEHYTKFDFDHDWRGCDDDE